MNLTPKQQIFINEYLKCWNATEAARQAGYSEKTARAIGAENLTKPYIWDRIQQALRESAMSAEEVLMRLGDHARGDLAYFADVDDLRDLVDNSKSHLVKKIKRVITKTKDDTEITRFEIELYDAQAALEKLGRHHGLFTDRVEHSGPGGGPIPYTKIIMESPNELMDDNE
jgi:phage terminase small subunit